MAYGAKSLEATGRFTSADEDSVSFVKKQLLSSAFKDALTNELKAMNLDHELFWANYDQKLEARIKDLEKDLGIRYKILDAQGVPLENVSAKRKRRYQKRLRLDSLKAKAKYGGLRSIISQYSVKKMTRSVKYPNSRYIRIQAKVSRREVHRLYLKFTAGEMTSTYTKLYLSSNFNLKSMSWIDTGVEVESDFTQVVKEHWRAKAEILLKSHVDEIIIANQEMTEKIKMAIKTKNQDFSNCLWMNINVYLAKTSESQETMMRTFSLRQEMTMQEVFSGKVMSFADFPDTQMEYSFSDHKKLSSGIAGQVYQTLVPSFIDIPEALSKKRGVSRRLQLEVIGRTNMADILELKKQLAEIGITRQFLPELVSLSKEKTLIDLHYAGSTSDTMSLLMKMDKVKLRDKKLVRIENPDRPHILHLSLLN